MNHSHQSVGGPPMDQSTYIPPGDIHQETYRHSTFINFPADSPVSISSIQSSGFYYTGFRDRVKCFSCGRCKEGWTSDDDPGDSCWHREDCQFRLGREAGNIPIGRSRVRAQSNSSGMDLSSSESTEENLPVDSESRRIAGFPDRKHAANISDQNLQDVPAPSIDELVDAEMERSDFVGFARDLGFSNTTIRQAVRNLYETHGRMFSTRREIVEAVLQVENLPEDGEEDADSEIVDAVLEIEEPGEDDEEENVSLQCRVCLDQLVSVVFYPCCHCVTCTSCGQKREKCPQCYNVILRREFIALTYELVSRYF